ncbi:MAG: hypothetical protein ACLRSD_07995 [Oscillibacter sp.]
METKSNAKLKALFIIPSITGIILFMIPVKNADGDWTVVVKILADIISGYIGGFLPLLCVLILTVSAVMSVIALAKPKFIMNSDIMKECFACKPIWVVPACSRSSSCGSPIWVSARTAWVSSV